MADTGVVKFVNPLIADNLLSTLEVLVERDEVNIEIPNNRNGIKLAVDIAQILKLVCWNFKDWDLELHVARRPAKYYTGDPDNKRDFKIYIWPNSINFKKADKACYSANLIKESDDIDGDLIYLIGSNIIREIRRIMHTDWLLLKRLGDTNDLPEPILQKSMISLSHIVGAPPHDIGLFYYDSMSLNYLDGHDISSKQDIVISDNVFNFLADAIAFRVRKRLSKPQKMKKYAEPAYHPKPRKFRSYR